MSEQDNGDTIGAVTGVVTGVVVAIGVTLFASLGSCNGPSTETKPVAAAAAPAPAASAERKVSLGTIGMALADGKLTLTGTVPNEKVRDAILKKAQILFGMDSVVDQLKIDASAPDLFWKQKPFDVLGKLKGLSAFNLQLGNGSEATLEGVVGSEAAKTEIGEYLKGAFVDGLKLTNNLKVDTALAAADAGKPAVNPNVLFNLAIQFAPASNKIPANALEQLKLVAAALAEDGRKIKVVGHTDNSGKAEANLELSKKRAEAVVAALVAAGAPAANLTAEGKGSDEPVADNSSAAGRAKNRRIAFQQ
jgi:OOP family OmpA-OmpF porin